MSQAALAQKAGIPQPNLSDMERGERDISLRTLRALALALEIKPGLLADGIGPQNPGTISLSRSQLERIAQAAVDGSALPDASEDALAKSLRHLTRDRRAALKNSRAYPKRGMGRKNHREWLVLSGAYPAPVVSSLLARVAEKAAQKTERQNHPHPVLLPSRAKRGFGTGQRIQ